MHRFLRYIVIGVSTFALDFCILYLLTSGLGIPYFISTPIAFLIGVSVNYPFSRKYAFTGTRRPWKSGYVYYMTTAILAAILTAVLVVVLVEYLELYYLLARVIVAALVGVLGYFFNYYVNFRLQDLRHR